MHRVDRPVAVAADADYFVMGVPEKKNFASKCHISFVMELRLISSPWSFTRISTQLHSPAVVGDITIVGAARYLYPYRLRPRDRISFLVTSTRD